MRFVKPSYCVVRAFMLLLIGLSTLSASAQVKPPPVLSPPASKPSSSKPIESRPASATPATYALFSVDHDCVLFLDGKEVGPLEESESKQVKIAPGDHIAAFRQEGWSDRVEFSVEQGGQKLVKGRLREIVAKGQLENRAMKVLSVGRNGKIIYLADFDTDESSILKENGWVGMYYSRERQSGPAVTRIDGVLQIPFNGPERPTGSYWTGKEMPPNPFGFYLKADFRIVKVSDDKVTPGLIFFDGVSANAGSVFGLANNGLRYWGDHEGGWSIEKEEDENIRSGWNTIEVACDGKDYFYVINGAIVGSSKRNYRGDWFGFVGQSGIQFYIDNYELRSVSESGP